MKNEILLLDKKTVKAIRICMGFNDDLRIKLTGRESAVYDFLDREISGLFPIPFLLMDSMDRVATLEYAAKCVCAGVECVTRSRKVLEAFEK